MKLVNKIRGLELEISEEFISEIVSIGSEIYPNECGGFLIGYYSSNGKTLFITDILKPKKYKSNPTIFIRSSEGIEQRLKELYQQKNPEYYIGEWHTHPNGSTMFSNMDLQAMTSINKCSTVKIGNPILLILSLDKTGTYEFDIYLFDKDKLIKYEK